MKLDKLPLIMLVLSLVSVFSLSCASRSSAVSASQVVTVERGNLRTDITGVGNLALSQKVDLAFEMDGTVEAVLVKEAESVKEGQLLAKLDTSAWEDYITALEDKAVTAQRNLTTKERAVTTARRQVTTRERDVLQAEINLRNAEVALYQANAFQWPQVEVAQADLEKAQFSVKYAHQRLADAAESDKEHWSRLVIKAEEDLTKAENRLNLLLSGTATDEIAIKRIQLQMTQGKLEDARVAVEDAKVAVKDAEEAVKDAQKALKDAEKALAEAKDDSPEIKAPFTGFITKVNVEGGDEIKKGTVAVVIADPVKFEAEIMVSEADILKVKLDGEASVRVEAVPGLSLPAKITHVAPSATIQSGVVNYKVKVELQPLAAVMPEGQQVWQGMSGNLPSENVSSQVIPERFRQAAGEGGLTQEQIQEMVRRRQQAQAGQTERQPQMLTTVSENQRLAEGMTVTVSIIVAERNNVLMVPVPAIISRGSETLVQVLKDGVTEERLVETGISDWQYVEIISGLTEGEQVSVPQATDATSSTSQSRPPSGGMFVPGMGRIR